MQIRRQQIRQTDLYSQHKNKLPYIKEEINMARKGENIYKRKDGRWEARYIKSYTIDGKAKYGYCYASSYHKVKEKVSLRLVRWWVISKYYEW